MSVHSPENPHPKGTLAAQSWEFQNASRELREAFMRTTAGQLLVGYVVWIADGIERFLTWGARGFRR